MPGSLCFRAEDLGLAGAYYDDFMLYRWVGGGWKPAAWGVSAVEVPAALPTGVPTHTAVTPNPLPANATLHIRQEALEGIPGAAPGRPYTLEVLYGGKQAVLYIAVVDDPTAYYLPPAPLTNTTAIYKPSRRHHYP